MPLRSHSSVQPCDTGGAFGCARNGLGCNVQSTVRESPLLPSPSETSALDRVEGEVVDLLRQVMGTPTPIAVESELMADLGLDSLRVLELVGEIEDHFSIAVPLNALTHVKTVGHIAAEVKRLLADPGAHR
jgi:acyl carrier protein